MTDEEARGTSGGAAGTSGPTGGLSARALTALLLSAVFLFGLIRIAANVYSYIADREGAGVIVSPTIAWMLEGSSLIAWAVVMIPCWFAVRRIRPPRIALPWAVAIHALLAVPVSLGHIALMAAFRAALWRLMGLTYHFTAPDGSPILYELRKDISAYAELVFTPVLWPDFDRADLDAAVAEFNRRERRFGGVTADPARKVGAA